jgi:hypothetical protein
MAMPEMEQVKDAALKYDKPTLARLAQSGQLSPTLAVMAGMMRDRVVQSEMKPPSPPTVAEEVMQPMGQRMGLAAAAQAPQQPQPQGQGLNQVPVPQQMFERQGMASGGIVAFQAGGAAPSFTSALAGEIPADPRYLRAYQAARGERMPRKELIELMTLPELQEFNRTGAVPERLSTQVQGRMIEGIPAFGAGTYGPEVSTPFAGKTPEQVDPFSGTQTLSGATLQTDPSDVSSDRTPSTAMLKQAAEDEAKRTQERRAAAPAAPKPTGEAKPQGTSFDSILSEIQGQMPQGEAYGTLEREVLKDRESRAQEKKDAGWLRLAEAGLGIMGGESPYFAVNVGKGAATALKGYAEDLKDQKKLNREDRKILADIEQARRAEKAGNIKLASERYEKALDRTSQEDQNNLRVQAQLEAAMMSASKPADQVQMIREMMKDPKFKEAALGLAAAQAAAKNPLDAAIANIIKEAAGGGGSNVGAQLGELMKKYPQAFQ